MLVFPTARPVMSSLALCVPLVLGLSVGAAEADPQVEPKEQQVDLVVDPVAEAEWVAKAIAALPQIQVPQPAEAKPSFDPAVVDKQSVFFKPGQVVLAATAIVDKGPVDGLEVLCCLEGGKNHESYARLHTASAESVKAAFLVAFNVPDGVPGEEESAVPAIGTPLSVRVWWQPNALLEPDVWFVAHGSSLVRDRVAEQVFPALPYVYTGSREAVIDQALPDGSVVKTKRFMLAVTKSVVVNWDEPDALLASPFPLAARDDVFEVNSALAPAKGNKVFFEFGAAALPVELTVTAEGGLQVAGKDLDEAGLQALLKQHFAAPGSDLRAVGLRMPATTPATTRVALRRQILDAAAAAEVWVAPVCVLPSATP